MAMVTEDFGSLSRWTTSSQSSRWGARVQILSFSTIFSIQAFLVEDQWNFINTFHIFGGNHLIYGYIAK